DSKHGDLKGAENTYPYMLLEQRPGWAVESICQRYLTMTRVLDLLLADPDLAVGADVVLHIGLNDCADRMFLEHERIALGLLPDELKDSIVRFAQQHRRDILAHLPGHHYVPPTEFTATVDTILSILASRARRVVVATIILPPIRFWPATPGLQANFGRYNLALMDAAARHGALVFDVDRHMWANQNEGVLQSDGMHLDTAGHEIFAEEAAALLAK
ncbi:MAG: SGNH/GDSL hydrolase family protein, partial [Myxococcales bacterium]